jgi:hypothetical protein
VTAPLCRCRHRLTTHVVVDGARLAACRNPECDCVDYRPTRRESRPVETAEYGQFVGRVIRSYAARVADMDIEALAGLADIERKVDEALRLAVVNLHAGGYSWTDIGRVLGTTRQAARQRFAKYLAE